MSVAFYLCRKVFWLGTILIFNLKKTHPNMRYSNFKLCLLSLLALGCSHSSTERYKHETEVFNRYLKTTRFTVNANKSYLFICTPGSACVGCDEHLYNIFCG